MKPMIRELTPDQLSAISIIERSCSVLSLLGCIFTIFTFCSSRAFHKPINRLVFYASFGNMMTNLGTLMSTAYLRDLDSFGCQFQGFLIQMFMPADAFWTLAMAINVYLTFYRKFDAERLRKMEITYLIGCYGIPFIPAFTFIFVKNSAGERLYGNALLWCWVSADFDVLRIAIFYGPVWVTILITFFIYIRAGRTIYEKRKQLHDFVSSDPDPLSVNGDVSTTMKRTEVTILTETATDGQDSKGPVGRRGSESAEDGGVYHVQVSTKDGLDGAEGNTSGRGSPDSAGASERASPDGDKSHRLRGDYASGSSSNGGGETGGETRLSNNRYNGNRDSMALPIQGRSVQTAQMVSHRIPSAARRRNHELNNAAWSYTKCAILFFTAILITWIPSTANRVYSVVHGNDVFAPLEFMSAFVLPLQGFWNAVIYAVTSWSACKTFFASLCSGRGGGDNSVVKFAPDVESGAGTRFMHQHHEPVELQEQPLQSRKGPRSPFRSPPRSSRTLESESMTELAKPRRSSADEERSC
ncbi:hypothetical protein CDD82_1325 [Ophiocordyceps australis]|uniref:G-protein coupled receptors family 2 profile 2 domain-containing protein n=1 Tax=Ophiocordyceps australis TaxID=1399860 RepID=A0A2C5YIV7_9HYPO|nr:hypothetical protein CDD82_1325 [Ophiocordyceps australis]